MRLIEDGKRMRVVKRMSRDGYEPILITVDEVEPLLLRP